MKPYTLLPFCLVLISCAAAPTRKDVDEFKTLATGTVPVESVGKFSDCLVDGFNESHGLWSNYEVRTHKRYNSFRVETYTGSLNILLVSADVYDSGSVELLESSAAKLINTSGEQNAFNVCLETFGQNKKVP